MSLHAYPSQTNQSSGVLQPQYQSLPAFPTPGADAISAITIDPITGLNINAPSISNDLGGRGVLSPPGGNPQSGPPNSTAPGAVNWASGLNAITGIGNLGLGINQFNLAEDQYASSLNQYNTNLSNQAQTVNLEIGNGYRGQLIAAGNAPTNPDGSVNQALLDEQVATYVGQYGVSGEPIA